MEHTIALKTGHNSVDIWYRESVININKLPCMVPSRELGPLIGAKKLTFLAHISLWLTVPGSSMLFRAISSCTVAAKRALKNKTFQTSDMSPSQIVKNQELLAASQMEHS